MLKKLNAYLFLSLFVLCIWRATPTWADPSNLSDAQALHLINRLSFGPAPGDIEAVRAMGAQAYIEQQLHPALIPVFVPLDNRLKELPTLGASLPQLMDSFYPNIGQSNLSEDQRKMAAQRRHIIAAELSEAKILRAVMSPAQLQEVMTDFWYNHFNVFDRKGFDEVFVGGYERDAIRPYTLGKFRDLLLATASHPAMIVYLDNALNTSPNSVMARGKNIGINENYAREVMELHTLGINGGYSQSDVTTLAEILTGWGLGEPRGGPQYLKASFYFEPARHDFSNKVFLGTSIRGGGSEEIIQVLDMLAHHPSTAHHISYELAQYFVTDNPPSSLVDKLTQTFLSSDGDISSVLRTLFNSSEFWDPHYAQTKFKPPFRYIVSVMRAGHVIPTDDTRRLQGLLYQMGEPLYQCLTPNGYSITNDQWLNSDALLKRIGFAQMLTGYLGDNPVATIEAAQGQTWSANTLSTVSKAEPRLQPALLLGSPEFIYF